ncbi:MAG TPA: SurA N-terminal domain-containing protein [Stellaceae bacterium]|nr:SurA N-terminal domain-containing protein [Stellaceae bacterium]
MWTMLTNTVRWTVAARMLAAAVIVFAPSLARAQQVVALVDGQPITQLDLEQRTKFDQMSNPNKAAPTRQAVIDELVDEILELREAKRFGIVVPDSEVDDSFSGVAAHMGADSQKLTEMLVRGGASANTLKQRLRAQMAWAALIRGRYKASLEIADSDVEAQLELHKPEDKNEVGYEYIMRPIVFVVPRGSSDSTFEARKHEAESLRGRFQNCDSGISFARALSEVAVRDQVVKFSADLPQALRDILDKTDVGHLTPPEQTAEGIQMFALCSKKETKSDTPGKKEVRDEIFQKKFGARAKRYLAELRRSAMIEYKQ